MTDKLISDLNNICSLAVTCMTDRNSSKELLADDMLPSLIRVMNYFNLDSEYERELLERINRE